MNIFKICNKKWYIVDSESIGNYSHENPIKFLTNSIKSSICNYSDAYILVTGDIKATPDDAATQVVFKNCASFEKCRTEMKLLLMKQILLILQFLCTI